MSNQDDSISRDVDRYSRQINFPAIGEQGQRQLKNSCALIVGCGALGSAIANLLARAGVGRLRIVDRDFLEISNLQRQMLFDEEDVQRNLPKSIAAANRLSQINSEIQIEPIVADVDSSNIESLCEGVDVIVDGSDNFEVRFLVNDVAIKLSIPWIYGGCLGADGQTMTILPGETACLNCLMLDGPPPPGTTPTCDSFGILAPIINVIAAMQSNEALKILSGNRDRVSRSLSVFAMWDNDMRQLDVSRLREKVNCPTCKQHDFQWLGGQRGSRSAVLCGRNAVQLSFADRQTIVLGELKDRLAKLGKVEMNSFLLRFYISDFVITVFPDGRAIVSGTEDIAVARKLYAQYLGG